MILVGAWKTFGLVFFLFSFSLFICLFWYIITLLLSLDTLCLSFFFFWQYIQRKITPSIITFKKILFGKGYM